MKRRILSLLLALILLSGLLPGLRLTADAANVTINATNFPDANFRTVVKTFDKNNDSSLSETELSNATHITCKNSSISSLKGLEYFTSLIKLDCRENSLSSLDLSNNTALKYLDCSTNQLTALNLSVNTALEELWAGNNQLTALDVSKNSKLSYLSCGDNQIASLNVASNLALTDLHCYSNQLTALDVTKNTKLTNLSCDSNQLTSLNVTKNTLLERLNCANNQLTTLDVTKCPNLVRLQCGPNQLTSLDVSKNPALETLYCDRNRLTSLDLSKNPALASFLCYQNDLAALDVSKNIKLTYLDCNTNDILSLDVSKNTELKTLKCAYNEISYLDVSKNTKLTFFDCCLDNLTVLDVSSVPAIREAVLSGTYQGGGYQYGDIRLYVASHTVVVTDSRGLPINAAYFPDANFRAALKAFDADSNSWFSMAELGAVTKIDCHGKSIASLQGVTFFRNLSTLNCQDNQMTSLDLQRCCNLKTVYCYNNQLTSLIVQKCPQLTELWCHNNKLTELIVSGNPELTVLCCGDNQLKNLDVYANKKLQKLYFYRNGMTNNVMLTNNPELTYLSCFGNQFTFLNLYGNPKLEELYCQQGTLKSLDLSRNPALRICSCFSNQLTALNLSYTPKLVNLDCHFNQITSLNVSPAKGLSYARKYGEKDDWGSYIRYTTTGTALIVDSSVSLTTGDPNPFVDVKTSDPYYNAVLWAYYHGPCQVTNGTDATHFTPNNTVTRGQAVRFLWNAVGQPAPANTQNPFTDNKKGRFYYDAVLWAYYNDPRITDGTSATTFSPNNTCNRAQIITFLWKTVGRPKPTISNPYTDVRTGRYYTDAAVWAYQMGIEKGEDGKFSPNKECTRAAIVLYMYRFYTGRDLME